MDEGRILPAPSSPYGMRQGGLSYSNGVENKYLYNGKELQDDQLNGTKLNWYDYGWRDYMPDLGRFTALDPQAEVAVSLTPYRYGLNNPIRFVDRNGRTEYERNRALEYARQFIAQNPNQSSNCYGYAGYHAGVPGDAIDCSGFVSQCANYAGVGYLNSPPEQANGVSNILNQPIINSLDPTEIVPGNIVTMSNRVTWNGIPVGHVAIIELVTRDKEGNIIGLTILHSRGSQGPVRQYVDFTDPNDDYADLISTFNYWSWDNPESSTTDYTNNNQTSDDSFDDKSNGKSNGTNWLQQLKNVWNKGMEYFEQWLQAAGVNYTIKE